MLFKFLFLLLLLLCGIVVFWSVGPWFVGCYFFHIVILLRLSGNRCAFGCILLLVWGSISWYIEDLFQSIEELSFGHPPIGISVNLLERVPNVIEGNLLGVAHAGEEILEEVVELVLVERLVIVGVILGEYFVNVVFELILGDVHK